MKALIQRVSKASVKVDDEIISQIDRGLLILLGVCNNDTEKDTTKLTEKIIKLRVFKDNEGKMNKSVSDIGGKILLVSQFTLCAHTKRGNRPSFIDAANPEIANKLYELMKIKLKKSVSVKTGKFGAHMHIELINDGPVTIMLDTKE